MKSFLVGLGLISAICFYLWPLQSPDLHVGMYGQDAVAHDRNLESYCQSFPSLGLHKLDSLFAPVGVQLALNTDSLPFAAISCLWPGENPIARFHFLAALNWLVLWCVLGLWARRKFRSWLTRASFVIALSFGAFMQVRALGHYNLFPLMWAPFSLLLMLWPPLPEKRRTLAVYSSLVTLTFLSSWQCFPFLAILFIVLLVRQFIMSQARLRLLQNLTMTLPIPLALIAFFMTPIILASQKVLLRTDLAATGFRLFNSDLLSYFIPGPQSPFFDFSRDLLGSAYPVPQGLYEGVNSFEYGILLLFPLVFVYRRELSKELRWILPIVGIYFVLSFGSEFRIGNQLIFENPIFAWLHHLPPFSLTRTPARYATMVIALTTWLCCQAFDLWIGSTERNRMPPRRRVAVGAALCLFIAFSAGLLNGRGQQVYTQNFRELIPEVGLQKMSSNLDGESLTVQLPLALMGDPSQNFLQLFHRQKLVNGYISYTQMTDATLAYINQHRFLYALDCGQNERMWNDVFATEESFQSSSSEIYKALKETNIKYVILNWQLLQVANCQSLMRFFIKAKADSDLYEVLEEKGLYSILRVKEPTRF